MDHPREFVVISVIFVVISVVLAAVVGRLWDGTDNMVFCAADVVDILENNTHCHCCCCCVLPPVLPFFFLFLPVSPTSASVPLMWETMVSRSNTAASLLQLFCSSLCCNSDHLA